MTVGEAFLLSLLQLIFQKLCSISIELKDLAPNWDFENELENLRMTIPRIQAVLNDAEMKQMKDIAVKMWLDDLTHVTYDLEDLLDEIETEVLRKKVEEEEEEEESPSLDTYHHQQQQQQVKNNRSPVSRTAFSFGFDISTKISPIMERLEKIVKWRDVLGLREDGVGGSSGGFIIERPPTSSLVNKSRVYGRDKDKEKIIDLLLLLSSSDPSVIPIVGMGGCGKTTLAQLVYNDDRVVDHFDLKAWVFVSDNKFDVLRLTKAILESVSGRRCDLEQLDTVQVNIKKILSRKKFLIVLDDVWHENYNDWELLWTPFAAGAQGSKIIVTTQSERVSSIMGMSVQAPHRLKGLSGEDCWSLFAQHAFADRNPDAHPNLVAIGKKIVDKCKGVPLAVKTLGGLLRSKMAVDEWEDILNSEMWALQGDIIPSLRLSYHYLPSHLKRCFAYCSTFLKGYTFMREELVHLWVAGGFVHQEGRKLMEDIAREYFEELCLRSFFEQSNRGDSLFDCLINPGRDRSLFIMHDLIFDLAVSISGEISCRWESDESRISEKARYSSYFCGGEYEGTIKFEAFYDSKRLRTFLPLTLSVADYLACVSFIAGSSRMQIQYDLFSRLRCLRVLRFRGCSIMDLPHSISNLKHLRYLDLSQTFIKRLPESITTLINLQTLLLIGCQRLTELPKDLGNLINLRHLETTMCDQLTKTPPGIGRLTSLQTLSNFVVGANYTPRSRITELRNMLHLRGSLCISNLKNVVYVQDAMEANLKDKHLSRLDLNWCSFDDFRDEKIDEDVLDGLQPNPSDLQKLLVSFYSGSRFPSWIGDPSFSNLTFVSLNNCRKCRSLPSLGQLPLLKVLYIKNIHEVKSVGRELYGDGLLGKKFCSLEKLIFSYMPEWEEWSTTVEGGEEEFPRLRDLIIESCPKLRKFSHCFPALVKLTISNCEILTSLPKHPSSLDNVELDEGSKEFPRLRELCIWNCPSLRELPHLLPCLVKLQIFFCPELIALPRLPLIKELALSECDKMILRRVPELISLSHLRISSFPNLNCLPEGSLKRLTELEELEIIDCPELVIRHNDVGSQRLASLRHLKISNCPKLLFLPPGFRSGQQLQELSIIQCEKLESLPKGLHNLMSLQKLKIKECPALISFPEMESFPPFLQHLEIVKCENLQSLPGQLMQNNSLEYLKIESCSSITSFPSRGLARFPISLKTIEIIDCRNLESLPQGLHNLTYLMKLRLEGCPNLVPFTERGLPTKLQMLIIIECANLELLPSWKLQSLNSLKELTIGGYPYLVSFPKGLLPSTLTTLCIQRCQNLKSLPKEIHNLTSLRYLKIIDCPSVVSFSGGLLPITLKSLSIERCENLKSLPQELHNLTSLHYLTIMGCQELESLPEEGLPTMLHELNIERCPLLKQRCQKEKGEDWSKIAHIPEIFMDGIDIVGL